MTMGLQLGLFSRARLALYQSGTKVSTEKDKSSESLIGPAWTLSTAGSEMIRTIPLDPPIARWSAYEEVLALRTILPSYAALLLETMLTTRALIPTAAWPGQLAYRPLA